MTAGTEAICSMKANFCSHKQRQAWFQKAQANIPHITDINPTALGGEKTKQKTITREFTKYNERKY